MANSKHLTILKQGAAAWNAWRAEDSEWPDLRGADLRGIDLSGADLREAELDGVDLTEAYLYGAIFEGAHLYNAKLSRAMLVYANLSRASLDQADLTRADLAKADLTNAKLYRANLTGAHLHMADLGNAQLVGANLTNADISCSNLSGACLDGAILAGADLERTIVVGTSLRGAGLQNCRVFAVSAWDADLEGAVQNDLVITRRDEPTITVDNLEVAQFVYLLLRTPKIREVIDTITSKMVLILGRFTPERKAVLDRLRDALRERDFLPVLFDFEGPVSRDVTETVSTLAHLARFVVADLTDPRSIPQELQRIVPQLPSLPVQPILHSSQEPYGMFPHFERYPWVLKPYRYDSLEQLMDALDEHVLAPAVRKSEELRAT